MKEAIILAGGFGTRLQSVISDVPKPMSPIGNQPFLEILLRQLSFYGFSKVILSVGYKHEVIRNYFGHRFSSMQIEYCIEDTPLGTGGAILRSMSMLTSDDVLVMNGDSIFLLPLDVFYHFYRSQQTPVSIALKAANDFDRYGAVILDGDKVIGFEEKKQVAHGVFNAGLYWLKSSVKNKISALGEQGAFSFEKEVLEKQRLPMSGCVFHDYFIDIGIPEDYQKAQEELTNVFEYYVGGKK
ncbi:MAG: nucleotidyltransferase family protein [Bacteroidales bacterium]|jgi:D-glycero-alpha-D-manno-heptose 1-phosphate guanylyltransferase|nr:nucleotidyltransferase family protein [Bacteroidales bacterium]